jgi:SAM-dependent methyltransferase
MRSKPKGLEQRYAEQFCDASVVEAYAHRPPYPAELFAILAELAIDSPRAVLDIGCGRGEVARGVLRWAERVDAVDASAAMIEAGRKLAGGDDLRLRWICASVEQAALSPPYALITAGSSLHWMDWEVVLPRLAAALSGNGMLALFDDQTLPPPWHAQLVEIIPRFSTNRDFEPYHLIDELVQRGLFRLVGSRQTVPVPFHQPIESYIESFHSRNGFSRQRMTRDAADAFDAAVRGIVSPHARGDDETVELKPLSAVTWGRPGA